MTRSRFTALGVVVVVLCLILYAWRGLLQSSEITAMIALVVAYAGLLPFFIGFVLQWIFLKIVIPPYAAWALALGIVVIQWMVSGKAPFMVMERKTISIVASLIITGIFVYLGLKTSRALLKTEAR